MSIRLQESLGALIAAAGIIWASSSITHDFSQMTLLRMPERGPLELCAAGVIVWLVAKWRRSVQLR